MRATMFNHDAQRRRFATLGVAAVVVLVASGVGAADAPSVDQTCPPLLRHAFVPIQGGAPQSLCQYRGKVVLVVNTASECGYTPQYEGLEALYRKYRARGLVVVGFPSNDFGAQERGTNQQIAEFCRTVYGVEFPMVEKQRVIGENANALHKSLAASTGQTPKWNFHKYVIDRGGSRVASFASAVEPQSREIVALVEQLLNDKPAAR